ncbi:MAG: NAD-dependent epimerase/dehydratase family protein [Pseudomonadota bacterium]
MQAELGDRTSNPITGSRVALTGATGFIGRQVMDALVRGGDTVAALTRQDRPAQTGVRWVVGDLADRDALTDLVDGADCVVHLAGATNAVRPEDFHTINTLGTRALAEVSAAQGVAHLLFMSSLAAIRPTVSPYAASKAEAERDLGAIADGMATTVIRAPAVLGPGDTATVPLFSNLAKGLLPVPGGAWGQHRFSIIDVSDLTQLVVGCVRHPPAATQTITPFGHQRLGWPDMAASASRVLDRRVRQITIPPRVLQLVASATDTVAKMRGKALVFSRDKLKELQAGDWIAISPIDDPLPLDETIRRCLAPFSTRSTRRTETLPQEF